MIRIYYPKHYERGLPRVELFPLLKAFEKADSFTDEERIALYGVSDKEYDFVDDVIDCDIVILPMSWNYYIKNKRINIAEELINRAKKLNKTVYSYMGGDYGVMIPNYVNVIVLRPNGYRSKLNRNHQGIPIFIDDPLVRLKNTTILNSEMSFGLPKIGFCGQVNKSIYNAFKEIAAVIFRNLKYTFKFSNNGPQKTLSSSFLRNQVLAVIKKSDLLEDQFIERKAYRAGVTNVKDKERTTKEFYDNIKNTEYTVCVRGAGNFSVRLYETLAMGRIPILVNTDCLYPLEEIIPWKEHVVWVEKNEVKKLPMIVDEFHSKLTIGKRNDLFQKNRTLWESKLSLGSYFKALFTEI